MIIFTYVWYAMLLAFTNGPGILAGRISLLPAWLA